MAKKYADRTREELIAEILELKSEIKRKDSALRRVISRSNGNNAVKATAQIALKPN
jgi:predicted transcriptional regulator